MNNNTTETMTPLPPRKEFSRFVDNAFFKGLLKEAKRVGYTVISHSENMENPKRDIYGYTVNDGDEMVFKGLKFRGGVYAATFSTKYWKDATVV